MATWRVVVVVTEVVTVLLGVAGVTVDDKDDVAVVVVCVTLVGGTAGGMGSVSSQTVFLLPRRLRSLPLVTKIMQMYKIYLTFHYLFVLLRETYSAFSTRAPLLLLLFSWLAAFAI